MYQVTFDYRDHIIFQKPTNKLQININITNDHVAPCAQF